MLFNCVVVQGRRAEVKAKKRGEHTNPSSPLQEKVKSPAECFLIEELKQQLEDSRAAMKAMQEEIVQVRTLPVPPAPIQPDPSTAPLGVIDPSAPSVVPHDVAAPPAPSVVPLGVANNTPAAGMYHDTRSHTLHFIYVYVYNTISEWLIA